MAAESLDDTSVKSPSARSRKQEEERGPSVARWSGPALYLKLTRCLLRRSEKYFEWPFAKPSSTSFGAGEVALKVGYENIASSGDCSAA